MVIRTAHWGGNVCKFTIGGPVLRPLDRPELLIHAPGKRVSAHCHPSKFLLLYQFDSLISLLDQASKLTQAGVHFL